MDEHREVLRDRGAYLVLECSIGEVPRDTFAQVADVDRGARNIEPFLSFIRLIDRKWFPILVIQPCRSNRNLERVIPMPRPHQRVAPHLEDRALHANAVHADGFGIRIAVVIGFSPHLERVVLGNVAWDAAAVVSDGEVIFRDSDVHEMLGVIDANSVGQPHSAIKTVVE